MTELHRLADKLRTDAEHLQHVVDEDSASELSISIAKRARRTATILVRELATIRDKATAEEA